MSFSATAAFAPMVVLLVPASTAQPTAGAAPNIAALVEREAPSLEKLYFHLHQHPELSLAENKTAARMAKELRGAGYKVTTDVGGYGVVGVLKNGKGPTVMLRGDMDALPIKEETGAAYSSRVISKDERGNKVGVMHACGHDLHMTSLVGAARVLAKQRDRWSGTILAVAQPAEERGRGSQRMLEAGLFKRFGRPDYALSLHADAGLAAGQIGFAEGPYNASIDSVDITVRGAGGHGAYPHTTRDPVVIAARLVVALQTIVSREVDPVEPAVVTVGTIHGGTKRNVIPEQVKLELTVRCHSDQVRQQVLAAIKRQAEHTARAAGVSQERLPVVEVQGSLPAVYNDPPLVRRSVAAMRTALGEARVQPRRPTMGGENFSLFGRTEPRVPIFMFRLGTVDPQLLARTEARGEQLPGLHSPRFLPEPRASIRTGVTAMSAAALELLRKPERPRLHLVD